jgi:MFS family permease
MTPHRKAVWFGISMLALSALAWLQGPLLSLAQQPHPFGGVTHALAKYVGYLTLVSYWPAALIQLGFAGAELPAVAVSGAAPAISFAGWYGIGRFCVRHFSVLNTAPRELWVVYGAYILENIAYGVGASTVLTLWLSSDLGFGDVQAGAMVTTWSTLLTLVTVLVGSLTDAVGVRRAFLMGFVLCLFSRTVMALSGERWVALPFGLYVQGVGLALMTPVMTAAMKRYSNAAQRSVAFSFYYALMNLGFAIAGQIFDEVRTHMGEHGSWQLPVLGTTLSTYRVLILWSVVFTVPGLFMVWLLMREGVEMTESGPRIVPPKSASHAGGPLAGALKACQATAANTARIFGSLWSQPAFYRFLAFMALVVGVRLIFFHMHYTFPKYGIRELGEGAPIGRLFSVLNPTLILILVPIGGLLTQKISAYRMVSVGSFISAASVFFIAMPQHWFQPLADGWLGHLIAHSWLGIQGPVNPLYVSICLFVTLLSVGEALWSPRLYEYAAAIAPKGQEGSYMALSLLPYFGAKLVAGFLSGGLLTKFCPAEGPRHSATMWFIIGCMALITPVGTLVFRKFIQVQEAGRVPEMQKAESAAAEEDTLQS